VHFVTADTNIYISGLNFSGPPRRFLNLARAGGIRLAISEAVMEETLRVLREKFHWPEDAPREAEASISEFPERVKPAQVVDVIKEDPADNRILECAAAAKSDFIVTGDQHLLRLGRYGNIRITKVADFLDLVATAD